METDELTSRASIRIIPLFKNLRRSILSYQFLITFLIFIQSLRRNFVSSSSSLSSPSKSSIKRKLVFRRRKDEEDTLAEVEDIKQLKDDNIVANLVVDCGRLVVDSGKLAFKAIRRGEIVIVGVAVKL